MGFLNRLVDRPEIAAAAPGEQRFISSADFVPAPGDFWFPGADAGHTLAGPYGDREALRNMTVYGCVRILADIISTLPMKVYRDDENGFPVEVKNPPKLITKPCPDLSVFDWKFMQVVSLCLRGNAYNYITGYDSTGWPSGLLPLHPDWVNVEVPDGNNWHWTAPMYRVGGVVVDPSRIVHIKRFPQAGWPYGLSPIRQAAATIGMALAAEDYGYRYFKDAANPSGALMTDQTLPADVVAQNQKAWIKSHGGRRLPAVLTGGFQFKPISITPEESQFLATRGFQDNQIQRIFGIPPHMLGDHEKASSWGTGIEQITIGFVTYTLQSWLTLFEHALSDHLPRPQYVRFDINGLLRGDQAARWAAHNIARNTGAKSVNEIRADEGMPPIGEEGDIHLQPVNYAPLGYDPSQTQGVLVRDPMPGQASNEGDLPQEQQPEPDAETDNPSQGNNQPSGRNGARNGNIHPTRVGGRIG